jgi:hypothetical protein
VLSSLDEPETDIYNFESISGRHIELLSGRCGKCPLVALSERVSDRKAELQKLDLFALKPTLTHH